MQKVITLLITAIILYMVIQHERGPMQPHPARTKIEDGVMQKEKADTDMPNLDGNFMERTLSKVLINTLKTEEGRMFMENLITPMNKPIAGSNQGYKINNNNLVNSMFNIKTFGEGQGGAASCGHMVTVKHRVLTLNNIEVANKTETYPLGSQKDFPGLDAIIVGMKVGQTRQAVIASKFVNQEASNNGTNYKISVELLEILPKVFIGDDVKIFDDEIAYHLPLLCGQKATFDAKVTKLSTNEVIFDSTKDGKKISMEIGNMVYPIIVSYALHNKIAVGTRTVIAPGRLFKSYATEHSTFFPDKVLPPNEYFMLELTNFTNNSLNTNSLTTKLPAKLNK